MTDQHPPTPDEIAAIRARREAVSNGGRWRSMVQGNSTFEDGLLHAIAEVEGLPRPWNPVWVGWLASKNYFKTFLRDTDAEFIAHAPQDIDTLLAAVDQQAKELEATATQQQLDASERDSLGERAIAAEATVQQQAATIRTLREALTRIQKLHQNERWDDIAGLSGEIAKAALAASADA